MDSRNGSPPRLVKLLHVGGTLVFHNRQQAVGCTLRWHEEIARKGIYQFLYTSTPNMSLTRCFVPLPTWALPPMQVVVSLQRAQQPLQMPHCDTSHNYSTPVRALQAPASAHIYRKCPCLSFPFPHTAGRFYTAGPGDGGSTGTLGAGDEVATARG